MAGLTLVLSVDLSLCWFLSFPITPHPAPKGGVQASTTIAGQVTDEPNYREQTEQTAKIQEGHLF